MIDRRRPNGTAGRFRLGGRVRRLCLALASALLSVFLVSAPPRAAAQAPLNTLQASVTLFGAAGSGGAPPFGLAANQRGRVDPTSASAGLRLRARRPFAGTGGLDYALGLEVLGRASRNSTATVPQLYGRVRYGRLQVTAGRRAQSIGRVDTSLSVGSTTHSRNAPPIPRVSVASDGYVAVPGTSEGLALRGFFSHGWMGTDRFVEGAFVHEKYLYARFLPPAFPVNAYAGITHHVQWGGTHPENGPQQSSLARWVDVALAGEVLTDDRSDAEAPTFDPNHLAMYDFSLGADLGGVRARAYRQFYHEDVASFNFRNVWDGLWGVSLRREEPGALVDGVLWEHLRMTRHNARFDVGEKRGSDSYYNHSRYGSGWTYQGRTLGTPLLTSAATTPGTGDVAIGVANNIVVAHHLGVEGHLGAGLSYEALGTYSRNYGAKSRCGPCDYGRTGRRDQYSFRLMVRGPVPGRPDLRVRATAALDTGELYDERVGLLVALTWQR
jgi:hypothetical protein